MQRLIRAVAASLAILATALTTGAQQKPPLLPEETVLALAAEMSGETAKRNLEEITRHHRIRGSRGFRAAAEHIVAQARAYGLSDAQILQFPADGKIFYGTQRSRPPWDAEFAELWLLNEKDGKWSPAERLASWDAMPITLAQDSESGEAITELVDVGEGTAESDYAGKDVRGKIILTSAQPEAAARLAVGKYGAVGIVSYAQNQRTAWWGEDENLVRWGHLDTFAPYKTFGFMISLKTARALRQRLAAGEAIRLHAMVRAGKHAGTYDIATATIPGVDPKLRDEEIAFSCHLDHQRPGANDNASGCVTILEVARSLQKLIAEKKIPPPARTIRFIWPPEIEGTIVLLNARPDIAARIKAVVHMDMVGGGPATKAIFHVRRGPRSVPSFVYDVAEAFAQFVNEQTEQFAKTGRADYPLISAEGGKEPLRAELAEFDQGSDHQVYTEGSWRIPAIYFADWPDRYIHTNFDVPANIDPTKLKRAGFIGAATAYYLATQEEGSGQGILEGIIRPAMLRRMSWIHKVAVSPPVADGQAMAEETLRYLNARVAYERDVAASVGHFFGAPEILAEYNETLEKIARLGRFGTLRPTQGEGLLVFRRNAEIKGPMSGFGYDYLEDKYGEEKARAVKLLAYRGLRGSGSDYAYEVLNFVDGKRTAQEIRDAVSAEFGAVPLEYVVEYLGALESIGILKQVGAAK